MWPFAENPLLAWLVAGVLAVPLAASLMRRTVSLRRSLVLTVPVLAWTLYGFWEQSLVGKGMNIRVDLLCMSPVLLVVSLLPLGVFLRKRTTPGHCERCGYNLTGNVSSVCPECGTAV